MKLTIGQIISALISLAMLYAIMDSASFANSQTTLGEISDMISAAIVWLVMIQFAAQVVFPAVYGLISRIVK